jgi:hypothetical protein
MVDGGWWMADREEGGVKGERVMEMGDELCVWRRRSGSIGWGVSTRLGIESSLQAHQR